MKEYNSINDCLDCDEIIEYLFKTFKGISNNPCLFDNRDFLTEWIETHNGWFFDDNLPKLIELLNITVKYINNKSSKGRFTKQNDFLKGSRLNNMEKIQNSVKGNLIKVKVDLEDLFLKGEKTDSLLKLIDEALDRIELFVPTVNKVNCNVDEMRNFLTSLNFENKSSVDEYIKVFQEYDFKDKSKPILEIDNE